MRKDLSGIHITIEQDMRDKVNKIAEERRIQKSEVYRILLDLGYSVHRDLERLGIVKFVDLLTETKKAMRNYREDVEGKKA